MPDSACGRGRLRVGLRLGSEGLAGHVRCGRDCMRPECDGSMVEHGGLS